MTEKRMLGWLLVGVVFAVVAFVIRRILIARERIEPSGKYMTSDPNRRL